MRMKFFNSNFSFEHLDSVFDILLSYSLIVLDTLQRITSTSTREHLNKHSIDVYNLWTHDVNLIMIENNNLSQLYNKKINT